MEFLFSSKKEKVIAIFDIGSGSVGGALVRVPSDKKKLPTIIKSTRTDIIDRNYLDFNLFLKDMIVALGSTVHNLYQSKLGAPNEIVCVLASPWYVSETKIIKIEKEHPFALTKKIIDELIKKETSSLNIVYENKYEDIDSIPQIIEHPIIKVVLDGQQEDNPIGKRINSLEMAMILSSSPKLCLDKVKETISKTFHSTPVSFSSFIVASYIAIRDRYMMENLYMLIDIGGEITDIGVVSEGVLKYSLSFPYGRKTFFRDICNILKVDQRGAYELFSLYKKGALEKTQLKRFQEALGDIEKSWNSSFRESINTIHHISNIPNIIFLTIDRDVKDWFVGIINSENGMKSMVSYGDFTLLTLEGSQFLNMCNINNDACDPFLIIESISVMRSMKLYD